MRAIIATLLMSTASAVTDDTTTRTGTSTLADDAGNTEAQGFAGDGCNIDNPGSGCKGTYRCAYIGTDFISEE